MKHYFACGVAAEILRQFLLEQIAAENPVPILSGTRPNDF
jgi:hypothetical protein